MGVNEPLDANGRLAVTAAVLGLNKHVWLHFTTAEEHIFAPPEVPPGAPASHDNGFPLRVVPFLHLSGGYLLVLMALLVLSSFYSLAPNPNLSRNPNPDSNLNPIQTLTLPPGINPQSRLNL